MKKILFVLFACIMAGVMQAEAADVKKVTPRVKPEVPVSGKSYVLATDYDVTYLIKDAKFTDTAGTGWTMSDNVTNVTWSGGLIPSEEGSTGYPTAESYKSFFDIYQTIENIPDGVYAFSLNDFSRLDGGGETEISAEAYVNEFYSPFNNVLDDQMPEENARDGYNCYLTNGATSTALTENPLFAGCKSQSPSDNVDATGNIGYYSNGMQGASVAFSAGRYQDTVYAIVIGGKLTLGVRNYKSKTSWSIWGNFGLTYLGSSSTAFKTAIQQYLTPLNDYLDENSGNMTDPAINDALAAITKAQAATDLQSAYEAAAGLLVQLEAAKENVAAVGAFNYEIDFIYKLIEAYPHAHITSFEELAGRISDYKSLTNEGLKALTEDLKASETEIRQSAIEYAIANATSDSPADITSAAIVNPDYEIGNVNGWNYGFNTVENLGYQSASYFGEATISKFIEGWIPNTSTLGDGSINQVISLPAGKYTLGVDANACLQSISDDSWQTAVTGVYLYVSQNGEIIDSVEIRTANGAPRHFTLSFNVEKAGNVEIGIMTVNTTANWVAADNWTLSGYSDMIEEDYTDRIKDADFADTDGTGWNVATATTAPAWSGGLIPSEEGSTGYPTAESYKSYFDIYQTIENIPDGVYAFSLNDFSRLDGDGETEISAEAYVNEFYSPFNNILDDQMPAENARDGYNCYLTNGETSTALNENPVFAGCKSQSAYDGVDVTGNIGYYPNGMQGASVAFSAGRYQDTVYAIVIGGKLTLGVRNYKSKTSWNIWGNFGLTYLGSNVTALQTAIQQYVASLNDYLDENSGNMTDPAINDALAAITKAQAATDLQSAYEAATGLFEQRDAAKENVAAVGAFNYETDLIYKLIEAYPHADISSFEEFGDRISDYKSLTTDELKALTEELNVPETAIRQSAVEYAIANATSDSPADITSAAIVNPDYEIGNVNGWNYGFNAVENLGYQSASYFGEATISKFIEGWLPNTSTLGDGSINQVISLPAGIYTLGVDANACLQSISDYSWQTAVTGVYLYASQNGEIIDSVEIRTANGAPRHFTLSFTVENAGNVEIGIMTRNTTANWIAADNWTLSGYYKAVEEGKEELDSIVADALAQYPLETLDDLLATQVLKDAYRTAIENAQNATSGFKEKGEAVTTALNELQSAANEYDKYKKEVDKIAEYLRNHEHEAENYPLTQDAVDYLTDYVNGSSLIEPSGDYPCGNSAYVFKYLLPTRAEIRTETIRIDKLLDTAIATGVDGLDADSSVASAYSVAGTRLTTAQKGISILRSADGTVKKVYRR